MASKQKRRNKSLNHYKFTRREIARFTCKDCGINVIEAGDYCMITYEIWEDKFGLGWNDNLCIACIEKRLGRKLKFTDFASFPTVEGYDMSATYFKRLMGKRGKTLIRINATLPGPVIVLPGPRKRRVST